MKSKHQFLLLISLLLSAASSCTQVETQVSDATLPPESTPNIPTPTDTIQGFLNFPYVSADAGNFTLQAGEQITITWVDAPLGASTYELNLLDQGGATIQTIAMIQTQADGVQATWQVPPEYNGRLEARAYFNEDHLVRSGCCANVYSNRLPPEGICSLRTAGIMPQHLYSQREGESERIIGIAPGLFLEVLARSTEGWYLVRTIPGSVTIEGQIDPGTTGWLHSTEDMRLFGPCEQVPLETVPEELPQGGHQVQEPAG